ncbi:putative ankyrin repeat protein L25 [Zancudomyces culisetae]|uniref:Putative ankyrin repeat protein L25 n=1 Tax=Zancudomyces culisetae TaxID=1213189 RepID=A0A1R1PDW2_ZANCU|nr:putative ankyrin repeat protein L25 [Zancudomyces culisetae]|eukprot:OMH79062.1 putative ankyrin repeat protein L25 [Zancudomyces culisetae]
MLQLLLENGTPVELVDENDTKGLCSIKNCKIAKRLLEFSDKDKVKSKIPESQAKVETRLEFNKIMLCLIEVLRFYDAFQSYDSYGYDYYYYYGDYEDFEYEENDYILDFDEFCENLYLYEGVMVFMSSKKKDIANALELYFDDLPRSYESNGIDRILYDKLVEIIGYVIENRLQSTFDGTENDETNGLRNENNIEVLNDRHYELAKLELVNRNFGMLKTLIEYGLDVNSHDSLILKTAYKASDIEWIYYFISKGAKLKGRSDGFEEACKSDKVDVLKYWINNGGVVPKDPEYPCINMACLKSNFDMFKLLVENGVDLSYSKTNRVRIACRLDLKKTLKYLLDNNAAKGVHHHELVYACLTEDVGLVKMILEYYVGLGVLKRTSNRSPKKGGEITVQYY